jgi:hypothetical protein
MKITSRKRSAAQTFSPKGAHFPRATIRERYAEWTALSALRSGAPIKSGKDIYPLLRGVNFDQVLETSRGPVVSAEFDRWHRAAVRGLMRRDIRLAHQAGWAAKLVNVYLKTISYVGDAGRQGIRDQLHPPVDGGLWKGVKRRFRDDPSILQDTHCVRKISDISDYDTYERIIRGMRRAALRLNSRLIEIEQLWEPPR